MEAAVTAVVGAAAHMAAVAVVGAVILHLLILAAAEAEVIRHLLIQVEAAVIIQLQVIPHLLTQVAVEHLILPLNNINNLHRITNNQLRIINNLVRIKITDRHRITGLFKITEHPFKLGTAALAHLRLVPVLTPTWDTALIMDQRTLLITVILMFKEIM